MKLSEAIRLGSHLKPQGFGALLTEKGTCAFGAAYEAIGLSLNIEGEGNNHLVEPTEWMWMYRKIMGCPQCGYRTRADYIISTHLNDRHRWTRERIADWISTIEPQEALQEQVASEPLVTPATTKREEVLQNG